MRRMPFAAALGAVLCTAAADSAAAQTTTPTDSSELRERVSVQRIVRHERELAAIAQRNGNTRASGTRGYDLSADYVAKRLRRAGYQVTEQPFEFPFFSENADATFERLSPAPRVFTLTEEFATMQYSGSGTVADAALEPVDLTLPPTPEPSSTSGCETADFAGFPPGAVALIQRGSCDFAVKAANAEVAGAVGVVIFNEGQPPDRVDTLQGNLLAPGIGIPVVGTSFAIGDELAAQAAAGDVRVSLSTDTTSEVRTTRNVIADSPTGRKGRTVLYGAHLDSVLEGPGINDNGSGSATGLVIAEQLAKLGEPTRNRVRFAFWGAEELGLLGSQYYIDALSQDERDDIALNLNFDMLGSPNYGRFVYDGDGSDNPETGPGPVGSDVIEQTFLNHFDSEGLATAPTAFDGRSDYGPFIAVGIPAGGLFSGAEDIKTPEEQALFGGVAGEPFDACYHLACDTLENLSEQALDELGDGAAHATYAFANRRQKLTNPAPSLLRQRAAQEYRGDRAIR